MSQDIALAIHYHLRQSGMSQKSLAEKLGVSPTYVAKLLKGNENLTLETISKVQEVIGRELVSVCRPYEHTEEATPCTLAPTKFTSRSRTFHYSISTGSGYAPAGDAA